MALVEIENLSIDFNGQQAVRNLSLRVERGDRLGVIGESGSGKSVSALAITGLLPETAVVTGAVRFDGVPLPEGEREMARLRGKRIGMVFQEPMTALNPLMTIGDQIAEAVDLVGSGSRVELPSLLQEVGLEPLHAARYAHEMSGGQRQRAMIAMALALDPPMMIMDEPTTALDVVLQKEIMQQIEELKERLGFSILFITHDLSLLVEFSDRIAIMYAGQIVEEASAESLFSAPRHPYTEGLFASLPQAQRRGDRLVAIPGTVPPPDAWPHGCRFAPRCPYVQARCTAAPPPLEVLRADGHRARCVRTEELELRGVT